MASGLPSKWGSFLQQAVAGVEARLDTILAEGDPSATSSQPPDGNRSSVESTSKAPIETPRPGPSSGRLQERLNRAVTMKSTTTNSSASSNATFPRHRSCDEQSAQSKSSSDIIKTEVNLQDANPKNVDERALLHSTRTVNSHPEQQFSPDVGEIRQSLTPNLQLDEKHTTHSCSACDGLRNRIAFLEAEVLQLESQNLGEQHEHVERADALESKLKFLAREITESARKSAAAAPAGSVEQQLAERDEKIGLLMTEGQSLATTEQKHRSIIKKLRAQVMESDKAITKLKTDNDRLMSELELLKTSEFRHDELQAALQALRIEHEVSQKELARFREDLSSKDETINRLKCEIERTTQLLDNASSGSSDRALDEARLRIAELEATLITQGAEQKLALNKAYAEVAEFRQRVEASQSQYLQANAEVEILENKLEAMRIIVEETSNSSGGSQAKLLRQIETLQSQHAVANENWQGIQASLLTKITALEKERDEMSYREMELRKKAKDLSSRFRQQSEQLQHLESQIATYRDEIAIAKQELVRVREQAMPIRNRDGDGKASKQMKLIEESNERAGQTAGIVLDRNNSQASPVATPARRSISDHSGPESSRALIFAPILSSSNPESGRSSSNLATSLSHNLPPSPATPIYAGQYPRQQDTPLDISAGFIVDPHEGDAVPEEAADEIFSPQRGTHDMASVSTTAAGPSIQLVERMSAGIRRLEAEKLTSREELLRVSHQRDDARAQIVSLMKEIADYKHSSARVQGLEKEVAEIKERYLTTLELLGEKSELVEELQADIQDVKAMYRDLVERTVR
ncbi:hypothetical protein jhhlp_006461 [Lomentospora prolificans]|uniref:TATA element modulatory factor 1 TATA binding domain-containing protein n=1 Tax=Lomentospora prolificans TaxID=41688 RepID=A0A2N3N5X4_9PEZI|nr:hypothetical protein jhhlp_006461 [Lomentospora prolificans]